MYNMAVVGHSMGGLVAKLTVTRSDDRLWYAIANRPLSEIKSRKRDGKRLAEWFYFEPLPFVRRVVFMGTPHGGAMAASQTVGRCSSRFVEYPTAQIIEHDLLVKQNPGVFSPEVRDRVPTSIDMMESSSCLLQAVKQLCPGENVQLHNIIGTKCVSPLEGCGDGVVSVKERKASRGLHRKTRPLQPRRSARERGRAQGTQVHLAAAHSGSQRRTGRRRVRMRDTRFRHARAGRTVSAGSLDGRVLGRCRDGGPLRRQIPEFSCQPTTRRLC